MSLEDASWHSIRRVSAATLRSARTRGAALGRECGAPRAGRRRALPSVAAPAAYRDGVDPAPRAPRKRWSELAGCRALPSTKARSTALARAVAPPRRRATRGRARTRQDRSAPPPSVGGAGEVLDCPDSAPPSGTPRPRRRQIWRWRIRLARLRLTRLPLIRPPLIRLLLTRSLLTRPRFSNSDRWGSHVRQRTGGRGTRGNIEAARGAFGGDIPRARDRVGGLNAYIL